MQFFNQAAIDRIQKRLEPKRVAEVNKAHPVGPDSWVRIYEALYPEEIKQACALESLGPALEKLLSLPPDDADQAEKDRQRFA